MNPIILDGKSLTLESVQQIALGAPLDIHPSSKECVDKSREFLLEMLKEDRPIYGVNTGFGYLAKQKIQKDQIRELQSCLLQSHAAGSGPSLSIPETRLSMVLRLNILLKGLTGVRYTLCEKLLKLIQAEIYPVIPTYGSVGASGDLAPLAHLGLPLIGLGKVQYKGQILSAEEALSQAGIKPLELEEKEGLGLINGTQIMLAVGSLALIEGKKLLQLANQICALTYEALSALPDPLNSLIHQARGHLGQSIIANQILDALEGSYLFDSQTQHPRVQDPYSLRCAPQVHGPAWDALEHVSNTVTTELNAATDNPLVFPEERKIISGGNFHGEYLALTFDYAAMALAELGNISERRLELLLNPNLSGLPAFLTPLEGIHSGYMAAQYLSASLVNENKLLANPSCTDSIPGNVGIEDHVSMGMTSARKLRNLVNNLKTILAIELVAASQAVDLRKAESKLGKGTSKLYHTLRKNVPPLEGDRIVADDIQGGIEALQSLGEHSLFR